MVILSAAKMFPGFCYVQISDSLYTCSLESGKEMSVGGQKLHFSVFWIALS